MIDMKLTYSTRDGKPVRLLCTDGPIPGAPVYGIMTGERMVRMWGLDGRYASIIDTSYDLIEVAPKMVVNRWANIYTFHGAGVQVDWYSTEYEAEAERYRYDITVLARAVPFVWVEGD